jgi:bifunctional non-homologous end joining protein LigD
MARSPEPPLPDAVRREVAELFKPALATLARSVPASDDGWFCEVKFDGYRMVADSDAGHPVIRSRNGLDWTARLPEIAAAVAWIPDREAVIDGEVVAFRPDGVSSFELMRAALSAGETDRLVYMVFDLLALDGWDLRPCRQDDRSDALEQLLIEYGSERVRLSERRDDVAAAAHRAACTPGLEGIMLKRRDARYRPGRSDAWLKVKCGSRQELVVVGFTDPEGARDGFGSLLLGYHDPAGRLVYAGRVGTGFSTEFRQSFRPKLGAIARTGPAVDPPRSYPLPGVNWVEPQYVAEIRFTKWTRDGILRHPRFVGLREDKKAADVVRETPEAPA